MKKLILPMLFLLGCQSDELIIIRAGNKMQIKQSDQKTFEVSDETVSKGCVPACKSNEFCENGQCRAIAQPASKTETKKAWHSPNSSSGNPWFADKQGELNREQLETVYMYK